MPKSTEVFVKDAKTRLLLVGVGLLAAAVAVLTQYQAAYPHSSQPTAPEIALVCTVACAYISAFALTVGVRGYFPEWSHIFIPRAFREVFTTGYKVRMTAQANTPSPYKWGSRLQVRLAQWAMIPLVGWLATQVDPVAAVFGKMTWTIGACVGGILAVVLSQFLLAAQHRIANPPLGESEELWREAEAHALGYITLCKASETEYDRTTVTAKLEDHFPDLHPRACHLIALAALGTSKNK